MSHLAPPKPKPNSSELTVRDGNDGDIEHWDLTIRFSASLPDLQISLPATDRATTATLKQRIRAALPTDLARHRIRLIHAGKALDDATPLPRSLRRPGGAGSGTPSRAATPISIDSDTKAKGKSPVYNTPTRIYVHCSIGDVVLSREDLAKEATLAEPEPDPKAEADATQDTDGNANGIENASGSTTTPAPRGFDRLLTAGFTQSEVSQLRLQFLNIQAHTHTPDTMPSPNTLRAMEDRWLDNSSGAGTEGDGAVGGAGGVIDMDSERGHLDDAFWGTMMGFFWPVGSLMWGTREEGVFSPRRKIAVVIGVLLNLGLGFIKYGG